MVKSKTSGKFVFCQYFWGYICILVICLCLDDFLKRSSNALKIALVLSNMIRVHGFSGLYKGEPHYLSFIRYWIVNRLLLITSKILFKLEFHFIRPDDTIMIYQLWYMRYGIWTASGERVYGRVCGICNEFQINN